MLLKSVDEGFLCRGKFDQTLASLKPVSAKEAFLLVFDPWYVLCACAGAVNSWATEKECDLETDPLHI